MPEQQFAERQVVARTRARAEALAGYADYRALLRDDGGNIVGQIRVDPVLVDDLLGHARRKRTVADADMAVKSGISIINQ